MKPEIPAANTVVATLYLFIIIAFGYVIKLVFKPHSQKKPRKYTQSNLSKGLNSPLMQSHISPASTVIRSFLLKYSIVGTIKYKDKCYLLKQMFIIAIIGVSCCAINWIILWPLALAFGFSLAFFTLMEAFKLPFTWNSSPKIQQQKKVVPNVDNIQVEPGLSLANNNYQPSTMQVVKEEKIQLKHYSLKFILCISGISFITLILVTQTMFTIYNSISNLGALNLGSVACVTALDQLLLRPCLGSILLIAAKITQWVSTRSSVQNERAVQYTENCLSLFSLALFRNLCEEVLISQMNELYQQHGESSNFQMGASPTRKKTFSPSKIPKAPLIGESETLMNLNATKRAQELEQKIDEYKKDVEIQPSKDSPIKQIGLSMLRQSGLFTTVQKEMFWQETENDHNGSNRKIDIQSAQKIKINPNQYFSAQRLPKDDLCHEEPIQDDGLVLVEAGLNLIKERQSKLKPNTIDIQFSPTKKRKKTMGAYPKRRQLIITGSSPYLQYLPDMMKKEKLLKKNLTPSSQQQIPTVSRKVL